MKDNSKLISARKEAGRIAALKVKQNRAEYQCECTHIKKGSPNLKFDNGKCTCNQCEKEINLNPISQDEQDRAVKTVDDMCDLIKMRINPNIKDEEKLYNKIVKLQLRVTTMLRDYYNSARGSGKKNKNNKNKKSGGGNNNSGFSRTITS